MLYLIATIVILIIVFTILGLVGYKILTKKVDDITAKPYADEKIIEYVQEEHDIDVTVLQNEGPRKFETGDKGFAIVQTEENFEFTVFIDMFGKLTGDDYQFKQVEAEIEDWVMNSYDLDPKMKDTFTSMIVKSYPEEGHFTLLLEGDEGSQLNDSEFLQALYETNQTLAEWNKEIEDQYGFPVSHYYIKLEEGSFKMLLDQTYEDIKSFEQAFIKQNETDIFAPYNQAAMDSIDDIEALLPDNLSLLTNRAHETITCYDYQAIDDCRSYKVTLELDSQGDYDLVKTYQTEDEVMRQIIFEAIQAFNQSELAIGTITLDNFGVPKDKSDELMRTKVTIEDIETIKKPDDITYKKGD